MIYTFVLKFSVFTPLLARNSFLEITVHRYRLGNASKIVFGAQPFAVVEQKFSVSSEY